MGIRIPNSIPSSSVKKHSVNLNLRAKTGTACKKGARERCALATEM